LFAQRLDHVFGFIQAQRGLCDVGHARGIGDFEFLHLSRTAHHLSHVWSLAQGSDYLVVIVMPDEDNAVTTLGILHRFHVDFGYQRTCGIDNFEVTQLAGLAHAGRHAMSAIDQPLAIGNLVHFIHKDCALGLELFYYVTVVHDLLADIDWGTKSVERDAHDID